MRKGAQLLIAAAFAVSAAACGGGADRTNEGTPGAAGTAGTAESLGMGERGFVQDQLEDGAREIRLGQLAQERGTMPEVKQFGATMVEDHTRAANQLKDIARRANVEMDDDAKEPGDEYEKLSKLSGREFDREYIDLMVKDHEKAVEAAEDQAQNAEHPGVKQWAASTLPRLKHHLENAEQLQQKLNPGENRNRGGSRNQ